MSVCKRTHQLKRNDSYWKIAKTACGKEKNRNKTTTSWQQTNCPNCIRYFLMEHEIIKNKVLSNLKFTEGE